MQPTIKPFVQLFFSFIDVTKMLGSPTHFNGVAKIARSLSLDHFVVDHKMVYCNYHFVVDHKMIMLY
jgi:hypothetical protein